MERLISYVKDHAMNINREGGLTILYLICVDSAKNIGKRTFNIDE